VTKFNLLLLMAVLGSCMFLVKTSYESRRLFNALDRAKNAEHQLDTDFKRLDAERQAQATNLRVDKVARDKLQMRSASPAVTQYVTDGQAASVPVTSAPVTSAPVSAGSAGAVR
jgi:cell division protein FtsL